MDIRTLRYFVMVARELNITRAAEKLNISQPPLSSQIRALEKELGVMLFDREKRRLRLTQEGELLLRRAGQIIDLTEKTRQELQSMSDGLTGTISLAIVEGRAPYLCAQWIAGFRSRYPMVRYGLWNGSGDDVLDRLRRGLADLAILAAPYDNEHLDGVLVGREPWVALIPREHPLAAQPGESVSLGQLSGEELIVPSRKSRIEAIRTWFKKIGAEPRILCEMSNYVDAVALTEQGVGISIFPQTTCVPNPMLVSKVISGPIPQAEYVLVWLKDQKPFGVAERFLQYVCQQAEGPEE